MQIIQYQTVEGKVPFQEWLRSIKDVNIRTRIRTRIDRLESGSFGDCRNVGGSVLELRLHFGPGYRIYFSREGQTIVILLCGGDKSTQTQDIERAKVFWQDYLRRTREAK